MGLAWLLYYLKGGKMPLNLLEQLIDKQDNFEVIRDQIALILKLNVEEQVNVLAPLAGKDPLDYELQLYTEASNPIENWLNLNDNSNKAPIVNVWVDGMNYEKKSSSTTGLNTQGDTTYNIDVYGLGISTETLEGHDPGDQQSALEVQRGIRLVRNIMMASQNMILQLVGIVGDRFITSVKLFQPEQENNQSAKIQAARITLSVGHVEATQEALGEILESINVQIERDSDGLILLELEFPS